MQSQARLKATANYRKTPKGQKVFRKMWNSWHVKRSKFAASLKNKPCSDCGNTFPSECMDWDHRPGEVKVGCVTTLIQGNLEIALKEIEKCDLVCANCHRIRTAKRRAMKREV